MAIDPNKWTLKTTEAFNLAVGSAGPTTTPRSPPEHLLYAHARPGGHRDAARPAEGGRRAHALRTSSRRPSTSCRKAYGGNADPSMSRPFRDVLTRAEQRARVDGRRVPLGRAPAARPAPARRRQPRGAGARLSPRSGAPTRSPARTPRTSTRRSRSTAATSPRPPAKGKLDPVIGRDEEIRRVIQVLSRRTKNNPVLIGEPGVGKTAIVEGLARRIVEGDVPEGLKNKRLVVARPRAPWSPAPSTAASSRSASRPSSRRSRTPNGEIITFIDELHTVVGAGGAEGAMDAGNMLKPMLARGELRMIGATTLDEYRKHIEKDAALERRFQPVYVGEPTVRGHDRHPPRAEGALRGPPRRPHQGRRPRRRRRAVRPLHHRPLPPRQGDRPRRRGRPAGCGSRSTRCRSRSTWWSDGSASWRSSAWPCQKETDARQHRAARARSRRSWPTCRSSRPR